MLHHLAGATIQVANLVIYNCDPLEDGTKMYLNCTCWSVFYLLNFKISTLSHNSIHFYFKV